jgi:signal transduction histidine kinase
MSKLLHKPFRYFTFYSLLVLLLSIPAYYFVVDRIWMSELDEHNNIVKDRIVHQLKNNSFSDEKLNDVFQVWSAIQPGISIVPLENPSDSKDSSYTIVKENKFQAADEVNRFRGLMSVIKINDKFYQLNVETNVEEVDETLLAIVFITLSFFLVLVVGFILLNRNVSKKIWKPFNQTLEKLKSFDLTKNEKVEFESTDIQEFEELNKALEKLIKRNLLVYNQQKVFIENMSHELQTPLTILKSKIETLLQSKDLTESQFDIINSAQLSLNKMSKLNKNLLLLAKLENQQFVVNDTIVVNEAINDSIGALQDFVDIKNSQIEMNENANLKTIGNPFLFEILFNNLLVNAISHSPENSKIMVFVNKENIQISNPGRSALNPSDLFIKYTQISSETSNNGIGLSIVKEIADKSNWQLFYRFENNCHVFVVQF